MKINYWDCEYHNYNEYWDGEEETRIYGCTHPDGTGRCELSNKYGGDVEDCTLLDEVVVKWLW